MESVATVCEAVTVNVNACHHLATLLKSQKIPVDREERSLSTLERSEAGSFYLLLVSICHQTSPRGRQPLQGRIENRTLRGWDYLSAKLEAAVRQQKEIVSPAFWAEITAKDLRNIFRDEDLGETLTDPEGRAFLIQDLGQKMFLRSWKTADDVYDAARGRLATGSPNLYQLLSEFRAYADPVQKKSSFFLALMQNSGLWAYADPDKLGAPVDYHEVRGHLRIGTVEVLDPVLRKKLLEGKEVTQEQDIQIRQAVLEALMLVSKSSEINNLSQLHYLFWNVFRSCCTRDNPHCSECPANCSLPERYVPLTLIDGYTRHCPFSVVCESAGREPKLSEDNVRTDYY
jgi:hypothetical protein